MTNEEHDALGASLRKARRSAGLSGEQLAEQLGWKSGTGKSKISKIESGSQTPTPDEVAAWAEAVNVGERLRNQWIGMAAQKLEATNYSKRIAAGQQSVQQEYTDLAEHTSRFTFFETVFVPRYLQIPDYSRAVMQEAHDKHGGIDDVAAAAQEKQQSVRHLYDPAKTFTFLLDEPILRRRRFPSAIMRPQLDRLLSAIGLHNVTFGIYPSLSRPVNSLTESSFEIFDDIAYIETALNDDKKLLSDDVERLEALFNRYWQDAVVGDEARHLILDAINHLPA